MKLLLHSNLSVFSIKNLLLNVIFLIGIGNFVMAQEAEAPESNSAEEAAKKLADPNATIGMFSIPIDYIHYNGDMNGASDQNAIKLSLQPSVPSIK